MARKIIGIAADNHRMFAVCDDGTLWMQGAVGNWSEVPGPADAPVIEGADVTSEHHNKKAASHGR